MRFVDDGDRNQNDDHRGTGVDRTCGDHHNDGAALHRASSEAEGILSHTALFHSVVEDSEVEDSGADHTLHGGPAELHNSGQQGAGGVGDAAGGGDLCEAGSEYALVYEDYECEIYVGGRDYEYEIDNEGRTGDVLETAQCPCVPWSLWASAPCVHYHCASGIQRAAIPFQVNGACPILYEEMASWTLVPSVTGINLACHLVDGLLQCWYHGSDLLYGE